MKFIRIREGTFINIEVITEVSFTEKSKQESSANAQLSAFARLLDGTQHMLSGDEAEKLKAEIEAAILS